MHKSETEEAYSHKGSQSIAVRCVDDYTAHRGTEVLALLEQARNRVVESRNELIPVVLYSSVVVQRQTDSVQNGSARDTEHFGKRRRAGARSLKTKIQHALQISHTTDALCGDRKYWQSESSLLGIPS